MIDKSQAVKDCVADYKVTGDFNWAFAAIDSLREQCKDELERDPTLWKNDTGILVPDPDISDKLCFSDCHQRGTCKNCKHKTFWK